MQIPAYPKVWTLGHRKIERIFENPILIEEKIDGSQFSFANFDGELFCRSHGAIIYPETPPKMFVKAVETARNLFSKLDSGTIVRCEYLEKPKHNTLTYNRVPEKNIIVFDVERIGQHFLNYEEKLAIAHWLELEVVPRLGFKTIENPEELLGFLGTRSCLGGQGIEGVVVKNYNLFTDDGKIMVGKYVSEKFKESNRTNRKQTQGISIVDEIVESLKTEARWEKAIQRLKEEGLLLGEPRDIGSLVRIVKEDFRAEELEGVKELLLGRYIEHIEKRICGGVAEWYKKKLLCNGGIK